MNPLLIKLITMILNQITKITTSNINYINSNFENNESFIKENETINNFNIEQPNFLIFSLIMMTINYKKTISKKLKELTFNLKHNNINNKSSWNVYMSIW